MKHFVKFPVERWNPVNHGPVTKACEINLSYVSLDEVNSLTLAAGPWAAAAFTCAILASFSEGVVISAHSQLLCVLHVLGMQPACPNTFRAASILSGLLVRLPGVFLSLVPDISVIWEADLSKSNT